MGGGRRGGWGQSLCWHQTSTQWQQMSAALWDCITSRPQCAAACERHSNVQAGHIPLVRALTCTSRVTRAKVTASPHPHLHSPTRPLPACSWSALLSKPARRSTLKTSGARRMTPLGGDFGGGHFYLFLTAGGGRYDNMGRAEEAHNVSFSCGRRAINIAGCDWSHLKRRGFSAKVCRRGGRRARRARWRKGRRGGVSLSFLSSLVQSPPTLLSSRHPTQSSRRKVTQVSHAFSGTLKNKTSVKQK